MDHIVSKVENVYDGDYKIQDYSKGYCPNYGRCTRLTFRPTLDLFRCGSDVKTLRTKCVVFKSKVEHQGI